MNFISKIYFSFFLLLFLGAGSFSFTLKAQGGFSKELPIGYQTFTVLADGYDIVTAAVIQTFNGRNGICLTKLDSSGQIILTDSIWNPNISYITGFTGALQLRDSTYLLVGKQNDPQLCFFLELDRNFDTLVFTQFTFNGELTSAFSCIPSLDKGTIITGETFIKHPIDSIERRGIMLAKLDSLGTLQWIKSFEAPQVVGTYIMQNGGSLVEMPDSSIIVCGIRFNDWDSDDVDIVLLKTDALGNLEWEKLMGNTQYEEGGNEVCVATDTTFLFGTSWGAPYKATPTSNSEIYNEPSFHEIDLNGNVLWSKQYKTIGWENSVTRLVKVKENRFLAIGAIKNWRSNPTLGHINAYAYLLDENGDSLWYREYGLRKGAGDFNVLHDVVNYPNKGFVAAGRLFDTPRQPWLMRLDSMGCAVSGCHSISLKEPITLNTGSLYPNPASHQLFIDLATSILKDQSKLLIYDVQGRIVKTKASPNLNLPIPISDLAEGLYTLEILENQISVFRQLFLVQ